MRKKLNKEKKVKIIIWVLLALLILFVIITSIILNYKAKKLEDITKKNDAIKPMPSNGELKANKIFFKNIVIFY